MNEEILKSFGSKWGYAPFHGGYLKTSVNYFVFFEPWDDFGVRPSDRTADV